MTLLIVKSIGVRLDWSPFKSSLPIVASELLHEMLRKEAWGYACDELPDNLRERNVTPQCMMKLRRVGSTRVSTEFCGVGAGFGRLRVIEPVTA